MTNDTHPDWLLAWKGVLWAQARIVRDLESEMIAAHDLPLTWFDVLNILDAADGRRLRMQDVAEAAIFTRSGMTRLVDRMEAAGLVRREASIEDRRGTYVVMTQAGIERLDVVWPGHVEAVNRLFGHYLSAGDVAAVRQAMAKVLAAYDAAEAATGLKPRDLAVE